MGKQFCKNGTLGLTFILEFYENCRKYCGHFKVLMSQTLMSLEFCPWQQFWQSNSVMANQHTLVGNDLSSRCAVGQKTIGHWSIASTSTPTLPNQ